MRFFTTILYLSLSLTLLFSGCKKDETEAPVPAQPDFVLSPEARYVSDTLFEAMISAIDSVNFTLTFNKELLQSCSLDTGNILVSPIGNGLLRKIESITITGNDVTFETSQATLVDLIREGNIDYSGTLTLSQVKQVTYYYPGVRLHTSGAKATDEQVFNWDIDTEIYPDIRLLGNFEYTSDYIIQIQISILQGLKKVKFGFEANEEFNLELIAGKQFTLNKEITLATVHFAPIFVPLPVFPFTLVVVPKFDIKLGLEGYANANITTSLSQSFIIETGIQYLKEDGWSSYLDYDKSFQYTPPQLNLNAGAEAYLKPELKMLIYNVVGPYVNGKGYGKIEADLMQTPWWKMYYGFNMAAGVKATILDKVLFDFSVTDLLKWEQLVGEAPSPPPPLDACDGMTSVTDSRDGQVYPTVEIGTQCWLQKNMNYQTGNSWCYNNSSANCVTHGRLYDWETALTACPAGFHLPGDTDWQQLEEELGMPASVLNQTGYRGTDQGTQLKSGGTSHFDALLSGLYSDPFQSFSDLGSKGFYWSSTGSSGTDSWMRELSQSDARVGRYQTLTINGLSVRCIKD